MKEKLDKVTKDIIRAISEFGESTYEKSKTSIKNKATNLLNSVAEYEDESQPVTYKSYKSVKKILMYFLIVMIMTIITCSMIAINSSEGLCGYTMRIVLTGSMEPVIHVDTLNIIKICDIDDINDGDIVCYNYGKDIIHRVIDSSVVGGDTILTTKGDANNTDDDIAVTDEMLVGKVVKTFNSSAPFLRAFGAIPGSKSKSDIIVPLLSRITLLYFIYLLIKKLILLVKYTIKSIKKEEYQETSQDKFRGNIRKLADGFDTHKKLMAYEPSNSTVSAGKVLNNVNKARAEVAIRKLNSSIEEFNATMESIDNSNSNIEVLSEKVTHLELLNKVSSNYTDNKKQEG